MSRRVGWCGTYSSSLWYTVLIYSFLSINTIIYSMMLNCALNFKVLYYTSFSINFLLYPNSSNLHFNLKFLISCWRKLSPERLSRLQLKLLFNMLSAKLMYFVLFLWSLLFVFVSMRLLFFNPFVLDFNNQRMHKLYIPLFLFHIYNNSGISIKKYLHNINTLIGSYHFLKHFSVLVMVHLSLFVRLLFYFDNSSSCFCI